MPMTDLVIKKVERYADNAAMAGEFVSADQNGVLFEWNDAVDQNPEHIIEHEVDPYPALVSELPGVSLQRDHTWMQTIEDKEEEPQGRAEEAAMNNSGIEPVNNVGVANLVEQQYKPTVTKPTAITTTKRKTRRTTATASQKSLFHQSPKSTP